MDKIDTIKINKVENGYILRIYRHCTIIAEYVFDNLEEIAKFVKNDFEVK